MKHRLDIDEKDNDESEMKRSKLNLEKTIKTKAILSDEFYEIPERVEVYTSCLDKKQYLTKVVLAFASLLPLPELNHLKRVRGQEVLICLKKDAGDDLSGYLKSLNFDQELISILCKNVSVKAVAAAKPLLNWQFEMLSVTWPCRFYGNDYRESMYNNTNFTLEQRKFNQKIINFLFKLESLYEQEQDAEKGPNLNPSCPKCFGIAVDPRRNSIVAIGCSYVAEHRMLHAPMVLIDNVARSQNGGAYYNTIFEDMKYLENDIVDKQKITLRGIPKVFFKAAKEDELFKDIAFGAEVQKKVKINPKDEKKGCEKVDNLVKYGPYICTGYNIYLSQEPCLMCAMALIHSRAKRIFYVRQSTNGFLLTNDRFQHVKVLNHHYEVFHCYEA